MDNNANKDKNCNKNKNTSKDNLSLQVSSIEKINNKTNSEKTNYALQSNQTNSNECILKSDNAKKYSKKYNILNNISAAKISWMKTGGKIKELFEPYSIEELINFLKENKQSYRTLGACTNTLLPDHNLDLIIKLNHLQKIEILEHTETLEHTFTHTYEQDIKKDIFNKNISEEVKIIEKQDFLLYAQAGVLSTKLIRFCLENNIGGLEFMATIPGTIGGMIKMNAGAYGKEIKDCIKEVCIVDEKGIKKIYSCEKLEYEYRHSNIQANQIVLYAVFSVFSQSKEVSSNIINDMQEHRKSSQPLQRRSLGSTFKNPVINGEKIPVWRLIDECGLRGYIIGDAQISQKHTNFIENIGNATSDDILKLIDLMKEKVKEKFNIELELENEIIE